MKLSATRDTTIFALMIEGLPDLSRTRLREWLKHGKVTKGGVLVVRADTPVLAGESVEIAMGREAGAIKKFAANFPVLFEDEHLLVTVKPPGLITSDGADGEPTFLSRVNWYVDKNSRGRSHAFLVHRLDREVSGILVFAKSYRIQQWLQDHWKWQTKRYLALVQGKPPAETGTLRSWLKERADQRVVSVPEDTPDAKLAITHYRTLQCFPDMTLLEIELETGRKNQIRVHLSEAGCPVVGDRRHGADATYVRRVRLHSYFFGLHHPVTGKKQVFQTEMPEGFLHLKNRDEKYHQGSGKPGSVQVKNLG